MFTEGGAATAQSSAREQPLLRFACCSCLHLVRTPRGNEGIENSVTWPRIAGCRAAGPGLEPGASVPSPGIFYISLFPPPGSRDEGLCCHAVPESSPSTRRIKYLGNGMSSINYGASEWPKLHVPFGTILTTSFTTFVFLLSPAVS